MWLSVVTIVKDDVDGFRSSLNSVLGQDVDGVEMVVIDGSHDSTQIPEVLSSTNLNLSVEYQWLPPTGIYAAMNAALDLCQGEYVYFLNAGDTLHNRETLHLVRKALKVQPVWAYGRVKVIDIRRQAVVTPVWDYAREQRRLFARGLFPAHQGTFVRREALSELGGFDVTYSIAADYAMSLELSRTAEPLVMPHVIADFHEGGTSTTQWKASFREFHRARIEILRPEGRSLAREKWDTWVHFSSVLFYRDLYRRVSSVFRRSTGTGESGFETRF